MDARVRRINRLLKDYDSKLSAKRDAHGVIHVYRKRNIADTFRYEDKTYVHVHHVDEYVISLTDTWQHDGKSVDWGLEPIWRKFLQMDSWRDDTGYARFLESKARYERDKHRMLKNDLRAYAAEARKDFAKATQDLVVRHGTRNTNQVFISRKE